MANMRDSCVLGAIVLLAGCIGYPEALPLPLEGESSDSSDSASTSGATTMSSTTEPIAHCGNGTREDGEECDGLDWNGATCLSLGLPPGTLSCTNCVLETAGCVPPGMVPVPGGTFEMGSDVLSSERPIRQVQVDAFWIDQREVTVSDYLQCVSMGPCANPVPIRGCYYYGSEPDMGGRPMNCVDWYEADTYCAWVDGGTKRLPTEAEWEKAARGTDARTYPWGDEPEASCRHAVMNDGGTGCGTGAAWMVGSKPLGNSPHGAGDMAGNVWEWVADWYALSYDADATDNPTGPADGTERVLRGGSWFEDLPDNFRASKRIGYNPSNHNSAVGFRCARTAMIPR